MNLMQFDGASAAIIVRHATSFFSLRSVIPLYFDILASLQHPSWITMYMISRNDPTGTSASFLAEWGVERWRGFSLNEKGIYILDCPRHHVYKSHEEGLFRDS